MTILLLLSVVILLVTECYGTKPSGLGAPMHFSSSSSSGPSGGNRLPSDPSFLSFSKTSSLSPPNGNSGYSPGPGGKQSDQKTQERSQPIPGIDIYDETNINTGGTGTKSDDSTVQKDSEIPGKDNNIQKQNNVPSFVPKSVSSSGTGNAAKSAKNPFGHMTPPLCVPDFHCRDVASLESGNQHCNEFCLWFQLSEFISGECKDSKCCCYED